MKRKLFVLASLLGTCVAVTAPLAEAKPAGKAKKSAPKTVTTRSGLQYQDFKVGKGAVARAGQQVSVHYVGRLTNGKKFDASYDRGTPFTFQLGAGQVIRGWDEGVAGMRVGGVRKLVIPARLGYGNQAMGDVIPANSTLVFVVNLVGVR